MAKKTIETQGIDAFFSKVKEDIPTKPTGPALVRKTYYVRADQHKALQFKAIEDDTDMSTLVRMALDAFLGEVTS